MPSDATLNAKAGESQPAYPRCPTGGREGHTKPLVIADLSPGVQYYRCERCGFVWATREDREVAV
jgi:hypothetical protein